MTDIDLAFVADVLRRSVEARAITAHERDPEPSIHGFGLARRKEEGDVIHYDRTADFYFHAHIFGKLTILRIAALVGKAERHVWRQSGMRRWKSVLWRVAPTFEVDRDFERKIDRTMLYLRGVFVDAITPPPAALLSDV